MNPSKIFFGSAIALACLSAVVVTFFGLAMVGVSQLDQQAGVDPLLLAIIGLFLAIHAAGLSVYIRGLCLQLPAPNIVHNLKVYTRGLWIAMTLVTATILVWSAVVESIFVGMIVSLILFAGLGIANLLGHIGLSKFS